MEKSTERNIVRDKRISIDIWALKRSKLCWSLWTTQTSCVSRSCSTIRRGRGHVKAGRTTTDGACSRSLTHTERENWRRVCCCCVFVCAYTLGPVRPIVGWHDREMVKTYKCPLSFPFYTPWHTHSHTHTRVFFLSLFYWVDWRGEMMIVSHHQVSCRWTQSHRRCPSVTSSRYWCVAVASWWWLTWEIPCWAALSRVLLDLFLLFLFLVYIFLFPFIPKQSLQSWWNN